MADNTSSKINGTLQMMDYWKIQDIFHERMKMDYENKIIGCAGSSAINNQK